MFSRILVSLTVMAMLLVAISASHAQGMGASQARGRSQTAAAQHRQTDLDLIGRRASETQRTSPDAHAVNSDEQGDDAAIEMRHRRDERTRIIEDYRETREPGQEGRSDAESREDPPEKPRWWKFWEK